MKIFIYEKLDELGKKRYQTIEISEQEAKEWVQLDFERRQAESDVPVEPRTAQEIMNGITAEHVSSDRRTFAHARSFRMVSDDEGNVTDESELIADDSITPEQAAINTEVMELIDANLTEIQKNRFCKYAIDGMTIREIADEEEVAFPAVQQSINYARKKLKKFF